MADMSDVDGCPVVPGLDLGTAGQDRAGRDMQWDNRAENIVKLLADRVFERDRERDRKRDTILKSVPRDGPRGLVGEERHPLPEWLPEDWRIYYEERAGILEFDYNVPRLEAERVAYSTTLAKWMDAHRPLTTDMNDCAWCHSHRPGNALLACLAGLGGHYAVHDRCLADLLEDMRQRGMSALSEYGIKRSEVVQPHDTCRD